MLYSMYVGLIDKSTNAVVSVLHWWILVVVLQFLHESSFSFYQFYNKLDPEHPLLNPVHAGYP